MTEEVLNEAGLASDRYWTARGDCRACDRHWLAWCESQDEAGWKVERFGRCQDCGQPMWVRVRPPRPATGGEE